MTQSTERADARNEGARANAAASMPIRLPSVRITREQLAAAQRASEYHAKRVLRAVVPADTAYTDAALDEPGVRSEH